MPFEPLPSEWEEVARTLYENFLCKPFTHDSQGRCNPITCWAFIRAVYAEAKKRGLEDPRAIDWLSIIDPTLEREENLKLVIPYLGSLKFEAVSGDYLDDLVATYMEMQRAYEEEFYKDAIEEWGELRPDLGWAEYERVIKSKTERKISRRLREEAREKKGIEKYIVESTLERYMLGVPEEVPKIDEAKLYDIFEKVLDKFGLTMTREALGRVRTLIEEVKAKKMTQEEAEEYIKKMAEEYARSVKRLKPVPEGAKIVKTIMIGPGAYAPVPPKWEGRVAYDEEKDIWYLFEKGEWHRVEPMELRKKLGLPLGVVKKCPICGGLMELQVYNIFQYS